MIKTRQIMIVAFYVVYCDAQGLAIIECLPSKGLLLVPPIVGKQAATSQSNWSNIGPSDPISNAFIPAVGDNVLIPR